ncbi:nascent polypeptide-associated complex subunit alpha, muscle-specific form-like [Penaeus monodon]|uniref:nascent polypeptide-associated complex subunit alpha, muscle-specific form-like n=1 Tax=Penaeus monodon TaxID=6687 RepID=UPI0018A7D791|nr:nascent polypeptide-associated complex subunit alpha, muscle-specific form-like [Penaeus monodon]XP_037785202.1 nascent polypeptide-associated complex subunit alpha, muscle-specific form-like [Penaeus monodon]
MIVTPTYSREMGEGGRLLPAARVPTLGLPDPNPAPTYKSDVGVYKAGMGVAGAYDHNKNSLSEKEGSSGGALGPHAHAHHLQPFTAPWLAEVAHITPARPSDHLPYPQAPAPSLPDYYPHYPSLAHRPAGYYPHPFLPPGAAGHFLRDYPRHAPRPYPPLDPRPPLERPTAVSAAPPLMRPLAPPPLRGLHPDPRDPRDPRDLRDVPPPPPPGKMRPRPPDLTLPVSPGVPPGEPSPRGPHGEPSPKRRAGASAFPMPAPRSPRAGHRGHSALAASGPPVPGTGPPPSALPPAPGPPLPRPPASGPVASASAPAPTAAPAVTPPEEPRPASPYHAHFARGALVTVGTTVRRVEELETKDFLEAARAADDLKLDPSTVAAICSSPGRPGTSTITFTFPSRNTQVSVEASLDHPFFVFHCGWSSCCPERTQKKYELKVRQLQVGDVCVSLTKKEPPAAASDSAASLPPPPPTSSAASACSPAVSIAGSPSSSAANQVPSTCADSAANPAPTSPSTSTSVSTSTAATTPTPTSASPPRVSPSDASGSSSGGGSASSSSSGQGLPRAKKGSASLPFLGGASGSSVWTKPAALRTTERQHSSDEAQKEEKDSVRKRRWSDPGQGT